MSTGALPQDWLRARVGTGVVADTDTVMKPSRASGRVTVDDTDPGAVHSADGTIIRTAPPTTPITVRLTRIFKAFIGLVLVTGFVAAVGYVISVATVAAFPRIAGDTVVTIRGVYPYDRVPAGTLVTIGPHARQRSLAGNLNDVLGIPDAAVVNILAGPVAELVTTPVGDILADGVPVGVSGYVVPQTLDGMYLARCVRGACGEPGTLLLVSDERVIGQAKGLVFRFGIAPIPIPADVQPPGVLGSATPEQPSELEEGTP